MARYFKIGILTTPLFILAFYSNCGKVQFSSANLENNNTNTPDNVIPAPSPGPGGSVQLSPVVNAVAFEDLYYPPGTKCTNCPDYDYNDFLTEFKIQDVTDGQNNITDIYIDFYPKAVGAGDDHTFLIVLTGTKTTASKNSNILPQTKPMFAGTARVTLTYYDQNGNVTGTPTNPPYNQDVVIFPSTHGAFQTGATSGQIDSVIPAGYTSGIPSNYIQAIQNARLHIALDSPNLNPAPASGQIDPSTFRVMLHVIPTNYDIDIINVDPNNFDALGYPWGFIIPTNWQWMAEGVKIDNGYPLFSQYRQYLLGQNPQASSDYINWFNHPITDPNHQILYPSIPFQEFLPAIP